MVSRDRGGQRGGKPPSLGQQPAKAGMVKAELTAFLAERLLGGWKNRGRKCEVGPHQGQEQPADVVEQGRGHQLIATERVNPLGDPIGGAGHGLGVACAAEQERLELGLPREGHRRLVDAIRGDRTLFATGDDVLASWRALQTVIDGWSQGTPELQFYAQGSKGPELTKAFRGVE